MLYANTDDGSSALWVLDGNGIVVDNISYSIADRAPILAQINEHYGTSFTGWSDNEIGLRFGDTVPNWNAYEKIEMPKPKFFKILFDNGYVPVRVNENEYIIYLYQKGGNLIVCNSNSIVIESNGMTKKEFVENYIPIINTYIGKEISTYKEKFSFEPNDELIDDTSEGMEMGLWSSENWQNAKIIS